jgi:hypothetical protein
VDIKKLEDMQIDKPNFKLMVHNGYFAWLYGSPQNPLLISKDTAIKILSEFEIRTGKDAINEMENNRLDLVYAEENDDLYHKTGKNRIIGLYDAKDCIFTSKVKKEKVDKEKVYDFDI